MKKTLPGRMERNNIRACQGHRAASCKAWEPNTQKYRLWCRCTTAFFVCQKWKERVWIMVRKVAVIMGSDSDWPVVKGACAQLKALDIPFEAHILSAHRTPAEAAAFAKSAKANGFGVILCAAGMAAHLAGAFAANTTLPVIGIPMKGGAMDGLDALLATVQMPSGFPVATVALNGAKNAAYLAVAILAVADDELAAKLDQFRADTAAAIAKKDAAIAAEAAAM